MIYTSDDNILINGISKTLSVANIELFFNKLEFGSPIYNIRIDTEKRDKFVAMVVLKEFIKSMNDIYGNASPSLSNTATLSRSNINVLIKDVMNKFGIEDDIDKVLFGIIKDQDTYSYGDSDKMDISWSEYNKFNIDINDIIAVNNLKEVSFDFINKYDEAFSTIYDIVINYLSQFDDNVYYWPGKVKRCITEQVINSLNRVSVPTNVYLDCR